MESSPSRPREIARAPERPTWCRVALSVQLQPPGRGRLLSIERSPRTLRITVFAPRLLVIAAGTALIGSHPWLGPAIQWLRKVLAL